MSADEMARLLVENQRLRNSLATAADILITALEEADGVKPRANDPRHARLWLVGGVR